MNDEKDFIRKIRMNDEKHDEKHDEKNNEKHDEKHDENHDENRVDTEKHMDEKAIDILIRSLDSTQYQALARLRREEDYPHSLADKEKFLKSLIMPVFLRSMAMPRKLTLDRLYKIVGGWMISLEMGRKIITSVEIDTKWKDRKKDNRQSLTNIEEETKNLVKALENGIIDIAREAYERGKNNEPF